MNIRQVEAFRALMKSGTTGRAAELLGVTQPAISRSIGELERAVGFPLFVRIRGRLVPSPEAQLFFRDVERVFQGMESLRASADRIRYAGSGELRVAALASLGGTVVPAAIARFRREFPDATVTFRILNSTAVRDLVASSQVDVGLAADEIDTTGVSHRVFATPRAVCALPKGHRLCNREFIEPKDLDGEPFIAFVPEDTARIRMNAVFAEAGCAPRVVVETIYSSSVCDLVLEGVGVGLVNAYSAYEYRARDIVFKPFRPEVDIRSLLLFPPDRQESRLVNRFVAALMGARNSFSSLPKAK